MDRKDIRRTIVDQLKKLHPNWAQLPKKQKKSNWQKILPMLPLLTIAAMTKK